MASSVGFAEFICEQISDIGEASFKKMFGEYMVYLDKRPIFLICNDTLYVKILPETTKILGTDTTEEYPYDGAKLRYVVQDPDNQQLMQALSEALLKVTPLPKPKKKKL